MPVTKLKNGQLPDTISSKTVDNTNDINTTTTRLKISGGSNGQVLSTDGASNISWITAGGGVSDGDKGDISVTASGATWTIDNGVVTYAKMQDVSATSRLLGRATAGSGDAEEITIGSGLSLSGTTLSAIAPTAIVTKTADETVTNSTTLQDDDHLSTSIVSGRYYDFEFILFVSRTNITNQPNAKFAISANSDGYWGGISNNPPANLLNGTTTLTPNIASNANVPMRINLVGTIKATANSTLQLSFAQNALFSGTGTTVMKNSRLLLWDLGT